MNIILGNGSSLFIKEVKTNQRFVDSITKAYGLNCYEKHVLEQTVDKDNNKYKVYGDDFKIEITPKNIVGDCTLSIKDFDENQRLESEILIGFNKDELRHFINLLQTVESKL